LLKIFKEIIKLAWSKTPSVLRYKIVRSTQKKFTFSVAAIILNKRDEVLLLKHTLRPHYNWGIPGGFVSYGEQPVEALRRELREEIGIEVENVEMLRVRTIHRHIEIIFRAETDEKAEAKSFEISDVGWFSRDNLPENLSPVQKKMIENFFGFVL
jgi:8-oxo-dGTP diphosphatase